MKDFALRLWINLKYGRQDGMELVQVAILIAIAIAVGLLFREKISSFVQTIFKDLDASKFQGLAK